MPEIDEAPAALPALPAAAPALPPDRHPAAVYLATLAEGAGRYGMRAALAHVAGMFGADVEACPWQVLRYPHVIAIRARLAETGAAPATTNKHLSAVRQVMRHAWLFGLMDADEYHRAAAVPNVKGSRLPAGRALDAGEINSLFAACTDGTRAGARAAAFALMFGLGLRRAEAAGAQLADYDPESGALRIIGKGNRERLAFAPAGAKAIVADWLAVRGNARGPLLAPVSKAGIVAAGAGMTPQALMYRLKRRARQAAIRECSPHDLRRTFVSTALAAGADLSRVQRLAGHASPITTGRYDRRPEDALREAAALVHVPYHRHPATAKPDG